MQGGLTARRRRRGYTATCAPVRDNGWIPRNSPWPPALPPSAPASPRSATSYGGRGIGERIEVEHGGTGSWTTGGCCDG